MSPLPNVDALSSQVQSETPSGLQEICTEQRQVSVVVPMFNEKDCVTSLMTMLVEIDYELGEQYAFEMVLVDDGSTDGTADLIQQAIQERPNFHLFVHEENRGIAAAIHTGVRNATNEVVVSLDADGSYDAMLIQQMVPLLQADIDMVTASPYHPDGMVENVPAWRIWLSKRASWLYRIALQQKLHCYTSCFRVYRRSKVLGHEPQNAGYVGVAELVWRLDRAGSQVVECPAILRTRVAGHSKMRICRSTMRHLLFVSKVWFERLTR